MLVKAARLKNIERRKHVYLAPDRSKEEREFYAKLTLEMKQKMKEDPGKYFYIRNRKICQTDRRPPEER